MNKGFEKFAIVSMSITLAINLFAAVWLFMDNFEKRSFFALLRILSLCILVIILSAIILISTIKNASKIRMIYLWLWLAVTYTAMVISGVLIPNIVLGVLFLALSAVHLFVLFCFWKDVSNELQPYDNQPKKDKKDEFILHGIILFLGLLGFAVAILVYTIYFWKTRDLPYAAIIAVGVYIILIIINIIFAIKNKGVLNKGQVIFDIVYAIISIAIYRIVFMLSAIIDYAYLIAFFSLIIDYAYLIAFFSLAAHVSTKLVGRYDFYKKKSIEVKTKKI